MESRREEQLRRREQARAHRASETPKQRPKGGEIGKAKIKDEVGNW